MNGYPPDQWEFKVAARRELYGEPGSAQTMHFSFSGQQMQEMGLETTPDGFVLNIGGDCLGNECAVFGERSDFEEPSQGEVLYTMLGAALSIASGREHMGGGLRVQSIKVGDPLTGIVRQTSYQYSMPDKPEVASGMITYEPGIFTEVGYVSGNWLERQSAKRFLLTRSFGINDLSRFIPTPGVMYEYVSVSEQILKGDRPGQ